MFEEVKRVDNKDQVFTYPCLSPYAWLTYSQVRERVINLGAGLRAWGMEPRDVLVMFENTSIEWSLMARSCYTQSISILTVYANLGENALIEALVESECTYMLTNATLLPMMCEARSSVPIRKIVYSGELNEKQRIACEDAEISVISFAELEELGKSKPVPVVPPAPEDTACIMYTSGTSGRPKGVVMTHQNLVSALAGMSYCVDLSSEDVYLNYLPLAHVLSFVLENLIIYCGGGIGYGSFRTVVSSGVRKCKGDLEELSPTVFAGIPTIYERIKNSIMNVVQSSNWVKRSIFHLGFRAKQNAIEKGLETPMWDWILFNRFKQSLGGHIRFLVSGSAPLSAETQNFIRVCFGVPLIQGYGLTESCSSGMVQTLEDMSTKSVGPPFPSLETKLVSVPEMGYFSDSETPRGELYLRGTPVAKGYYKNSEQTEKTFDKHGWLSTGDIAELRPDGSYFIIDRLKQLIKPLHGEYISLDKLESVYKYDPLVDHLMVYVDSSKYYCIAIVVPNKDKLLQWAKRSGPKKTRSDDYEALCQSPDAENYVLEQLQNTGKKHKLRNIEIVRKVKLLSEPWTPSNNYLTAAMKLNRTYIVSTLHEDIENMYQQLKEHHYDAHH
ncbi:uncharacterized protein LOC126320447 isoform X2 [Schistocerca gregaria]|nr:uncharacterized protein LOC126320447 isoform X2 [Schistocerca gregaria]